MRLRDALRPERIRLGVSADGLEDALGLLLRAMGASDDEVPGLARDIVSGEQGFVERANEDALVAVLEDPDAEAPEAALGVFRMGFPVTEPSGTDISRARVLLLLVSPRRRQRIRTEALPRLARAFRVGSTTDVLLSAGSVEQVLALDDLMDAGLHGALLVGDAMGSVSYRVYPDTPLDEVVDLIARRGLDSVPVVGEDYQVLGIVSRTDALERLLEAVQTDGVYTPGALADVTVRDAMSRSVLCADEDQTLAEAARVMVSKGFVQLPVVRSGELVGLLSQSAALRMLSGR